MGETVDVLVVCACDSSHIVNIKEIRNGSQLANSGLASVQVVFLPLSAPYWTIGSKWLMRTSRSKLYFALLLLDFLI